MAKAKKLNIQKDIELDYDFLVDIEDDELHLDDHTDLEEEELLLDTELDEIGKTPGLATKKQSL